MTISHEDVLETYDAVDKPDGLLFLYVEAVKELEKECEAKQAQIDSLMLEYCPADMSREQMENWEKHQRVVIL